MRNKVILSVIATLLLTSCSPRDVMTRRLATDLIAASDAFKAPQQFSLQTGIVANKDYVSPEYIVLQQHGWISANNAKCPVGTRPAMLGRFPYCLRRRHNSRPDSCR